MAAGHTGDRNTVEVRSYFIRHRNALLARAEFSPLYEDYYLHLLLHGLRNDPVHDALVRDALAVTTLHLCSRPRNESTAWTWQFQPVNVNVFASGHTESEAVAGRCFAEDVRQLDRSTLFTQVVAPGVPPRTSVVAIPDYDPAGTSDHLSREPVFRAVEAYYAQSEQRPARVFRIAGEDVVMVSAQPDCDIEWFSALDDAAVRHLDQTESLSLLEVRSFSFNCGCSLERLLPVLRSMSPEARDALFDHDETAVVTCPRCAAVFTLDRVTLEADDKP